MFLYNRIPIDMERIFQNTKIFDKQELRAHMAFVTRSKEPRAHMV